MKKMKKALALLLVLAMMISTLAGCGEKKTPAEAFFDLYDEMSSLENCEAAMDMVLDVDGTEIELSLSMVSLKGGKEGLLSGDVEVSGVSLEIPKITYTEDALYMDGEATADLLALMDIDYDGSIADMIGSAALMLEIDELDVDEKDMEELLTLVSSTADKVKADLMVREGAIVADEDEKATYILTLDGNALYDLFVLILTDVVEKQDEYIDAYVEYVGEDLMGEDDMEDAFAELEDALDELKDEEIADEVRELLEGFELEMKLAKGEDKTYNYSAAMEAEIEGTSFEMEIDEIISDLTKAPELVIPEETIDAEKVIEAATNAYYGYGEDYDYEEDYTYEEEEDYEIEYGSVEELDLTSVGGGLSEFTMLTYDGASITLPVPDDADWDTAYISEELTSVSVNNSEYDYYASYSPYTASYFDLEETAQMYQEIFNGDETEQTIAISDVVENDGVRAIAVYGEYYATYLYDLVIEVPVNDDEVIVIDFTSYSENSDAVDAILDYYGLEKPE